MPSLCQCARPRPPTPTHPPARLGGLLNWLLLARARSYARSFLTVLLCPLSQACSNLIHLFVELVALARDRPVRHGPAWAILALCAMDTAVDGFHHDNHSEEFCQRMLNPKNRVFPHGNNTEVVEQAWQKVVQHVPSLAYMKRGRFRMMILTLAQFVSMRRASTPLASRDKRKGRRSSQGGNKHERARKLVTQQLETKRAAEG